MTSQGPREAWQIATDGLREEVIRLSGETGELRKSIDENIKELRKDLANYAEKLGETKGSNSTVIKVGTGLVVALVLLVAGGGFWSGCAQISLTAAVAENTAEIKQLPEGLSETIFQHSDSLKETENSLKESQNDIKKLTDQLASSSNVAHENETQIEEVKAANESLDTSLKEFRAQMQHLGDLKEFVAKIESATNKAEKASESAGNAAKQSADAASRANDNTERIQRLVAEVDVLKESLAKEDIVSVRFSVDSRKLTGDEESGALEFSVQLSSDPPLTSETIRRVNVRIDGFWSKSTQQPGFTVISTARIPDSNVLALRMAARGEDGAALNKFIREGGAISGEATLYLKLSD